MQAPPPPRSDDGKPRDLWLGVPLATALLSGLDSLLTRLELPHRPTTPTLFLEGLALWAVPVLLAALLLAATRRVWPRRVRTQAPLQWLGLAWLAAAPVLLHWALNRHTAMATTLERVLTRPHPWGEGLGLLAASALGCLLLGRWLGRLSRAGAAALLLAVALACGLLLPWRAGEADRPAADPNRPNLLLIIWDTTRRISLSPFGYERATTPALSELAESSRLFSEARSVTHFTFTSHVSMLTGSYPSDHGVRLLAMDFDPGHSAPSIARLLREAGYRTGAFLGTGVLSGRQGLPDGFDVYDDRVDPELCDSHAWALLHDLQALLSGWIPALRNNGQPHWLQDYERPADEVFESALEFIERDDPRPWFAFVNLFDAHWPYVPDAEARQRWVAPYDGPIDGYLFRSDRYPARYRPNSRDNAHLRELYDAEIWRLDQRTGEFLARVDLDRRRVGLVLTSDHGEALGEHGHYGHEGVLEPEISVPFLVRAPAGSGDWQARRAGMSSAPVSGVDVAPTLLGLAGLPPHPRQEGLDLSAVDPPAERPIWVEDRDFVDPQRSELVLYRLPHKFVRSLSFGRQRDALYDLSSDPLGVRDVSRQRPDVARLLAEEVDASRPTWPDNRDGSHTVIHVLGEEALRALGYLGEGQQATPPPEPAGEAPAETAPSQAAPAEPSSPDGG